MPARYLVKQKACTPCASIEARPRGLSECKQAAKWLLSETARPPPLFAAPGAVSSEFGTSRATNPQRCLHLLYERSKQIVV
ncbi:hypothetical protein EVAR_89844_1 [Eumeta japonica]|uniref:Uncharacterized protein n=1 Tax=Eumeta variegata TaxID=151549 RepID=A0A4C1ZXY2_EUMVA|nr:hypothetical protein EVAR_89844_1 [Eumeta japonica]